MLMGGFGRGQGPLSGIVAQISLSLQPAIPSETPATLEACFLIQQLWQVLSVIE